MGYLTYDGSSILIVTDKGVEALAQWQVTELEIDITTNQQEARHLAEATEFLWKELSAAKAKLTKTA